MTRKSLFKTETDAEADKSPDSSTLQTTEGICSHRCPTTSQTLPFQIGAHNTPIRCLQEAIDRLIQTHSGSEGVLVHEERGPPGLRFTARRLRRDPEGKKATLDASFALRLSTSSPRHSDFDFPSNIHFQSQFLSEGDNAI